MATMLRSDCQAYHEMDIRQFCDAMNERLRKAKPETNLKLLRQQNGLSQKQLAEISSVPLRTLQQYEQRQKNINKAQAEYLVSLSTALNCSVEQLIERIWYHFPIQFHRNSTFIRRPSGRLFCFIAKFGNEADLWRNRICFRAKCHTFSTEIDGYVEALEALHQKKARQIEVMLIQIWDCLWHHAGAG